MSKAYENMRRFWLDAKNMESKQGVLEIGTDKVVAAGVEMAVEDDGSVKHVFIATNSLGDSSFYFENNSPSGLGGMIGGHGNEPLQQAAAHMLAYASRLTKQMTYVPAGQEVPAPDKAGQVCVIAVSKTGVFYKEFSEEELRKPDNLFYPAFAYSQQMVGLFKDKPQNPPARA